MKESNILNLDITIKHLERARYRVQIQNAECQVSEDFSLPFSRKQMLKFDKKLLEKQAAETIGKKLFEAVFAKKVSLCFHKILQSAEKQRAMLRIRLMLDSIPELVSLPWEYLYSPELGRHINLSRDTQIVRYQMLLGAETGLSVTLPLRVLVIIASPIDYPRLEFDAEWGRLKEAVKDLEEKKLITLERLIPPTFSNLVNRLNLRKHPHGYHIVHFVGHGEFVKSRGEGTLIFENDKQEGVRVSADRLSTFLREHDPLRVAFLNACETARSMPMATSVSVAQKLAEQGLHCVIGMQSQTLDEHATRFAGRFYAQLAENGSVDQSVAFARLGFLEDGEEVGWGFPVLYLRSSHGSLFDIVPNWAERANSYQVEVEESLKNPPADERDWLLPKIQKGLALIEEAKSLDGNIQMTLLSVKGVVSLLVQSLMGPLEPNQGLRAGAGSLQATEDSEQKMLDSIMQVIRIESDPNLRMSAAMMYFRHVLTKFNNSLEGARGLFEQIGNHDAAKICNDLVEMSQRAIRQETNVRLVEQSLPTPTVEPWKE